jgi:hypothetical protein
VSRIQDLDTPAMIIDDEIETMATRQRHPPRAVRKS